MQSRVKLVAPAMKLQAGGEEETRQRRGFWARLWRETHGYHVGLETVVASTTGAIF